MKYISIDFGINPMRFLGLSYNKCPYPLRNDGRALITIHIVFFVLWVKLPYKHITEFGHGSASESYGFVVSFKTLYSHITYGFKVKRLF